MSALEYGLRLLGWLTFTLLTAKLLVDGPLWFVPITFILAVVIINPVTAQVLGVGSKK